MYRKINETFDPSTILNNLKNEDYLVCLDSQNNDRSLSRYTIISCNPKEVIDATDISCEEIFQRLDTLANNYTDYSDLPFNGGFIGALSYHLLEDIYHIKLQHQNQLPKIIGGIYNQGIIIDHELNVTHLFNIDGNLELLEVALTCDKRISEQQSITSLINLEIDAEQYTEQIEAIKKYIAAGDVYELNFTANYHGTSNIEALELFTRLRANNPAPFAALINFKQLKLISSSPELFFKLENQKIKTQPMKGTVARSGIDQFDQENIRILQQSKKERSELTMIIDLMRNDLSKICQTKTVAVENPFMIKAYPTVFQQVADVVGELKDEVSFSQVIKSLFPSGSITGAPKLRSIEVIDELENYKREYYTGAIGYYAYNQNAVFNVAIRTIICNDQEINFSVGGAVVWDSTSNGEFNELKLKAKALYDNAH